MSNTPNLQDLGLNISQEPGASIPSVSAEDYINDPNLEEQWAMKAFQQAETYFNLLRAIDAKKLRLTGHDDQIYARFRETFPDLKIDHLDENTLKSVEGKAQWRTFCEEFQKLIEDYNFGTLIRTDSKGEYSSENTIFVVRIQFYAIEIARNREGYNDTLIMTRWDSFHERYFTSLATLSFDKAKELLEKDGNRMHPEFLQLFQQILQYERSYHNFGFVPGPKGNLSSVRKEKTLCECYSDLHLSLIQGQPAMKASPSIQSTIDESKESLGVSQLISGLTSFFHVRTSLMKLYEQISSAVKRNEHNVRLELFLDETLAISQINMSPLNISVLTPIHQLLKHEIDCLLLLIKSYVSICDYKYMEAISTLHHMHGVLKEWHDNIENQQNANLRFTLSSASPLNIFKSSTKPALYTFYSKFHELLVAKFSLYFSKNLHEYGGPDAKTTIGKTSPDFAARIAQFYRRSNVEWIGLILHTFKAKSQSDSLPPNMNSAPSTGASDDGTFQIIFSYPATLTAADEIAQAVNCKALINRETLITGEKPFYSGDVSQSKTYFLQNIDPRFTLVLVFASHRQERDTTIGNFLGELIDLLRGSRQLLSFKNAPK